MNAFLNPLVLRILLLILHLVPPSREGVEITIIGEGKVLGTYTVSFLSPGQYKYKFSGSWEEGKSFIAERSVLYGHLYTAYPDPQGQPIGINLFSLLEELSLPKMGESRTLGNGEDGIEVFQSKYNLIVGSPSTKMMFLLPQSVSN
ncbi:MAG: hypothetical protein SNJ78_01620 [Spirochaetales bacterium]